MISRRKNKVLIKFGNKKFHSAKPEDMIEGVKIKIKES